MADKKKHKWIKGAVKPSHKGLFKEKAEHAGKSTAEFASEHEGDKGKLGKEARLAKTLMNMSHKVNHKALRHKMYGSKE